MVRVNDGVAHYSGLQSCGSVWACPACAAKIRQARADELESAIDQWLARGGGVEFVTFTIPHGERDALADTFDLLADAWRKGVLGGRGFALDRRVWGIPAWVRTVEVTLGPNGWHPHIHALLFTDRPWTPRQRAMRGAALFARWSRFVHRATGQACSRQAFRIVGAAEGAGRYIAKVQESDSWRLGLELTRSDLKTGRRGSVTPFELVEAAHDGEAWALARWWEWEQVTRGRRMMTWSRGGRTTVGLLEEAPTDEELAEEEVGGELVLSLNPSSWARIAQKPGAEAGLLNAVEDGGLYAAGVWLLELRAGP